MTAITLTLIMAYTGWQVYDSYTEDKAKKEIKKFICKKIFVENNRLFSVIAEAIYRSSAGWLPKTDEDFFSERVADQICRRLNLDRKAPVRPKNTWRNHLGEKCKNYRNSLNEILQNYGTNLPPELIKAISSTERTVFLNLSEQMMRLPEIDRELGVVRPPILCWGLEPMIRESFLLIGELHKEIAILAENLNLNYSSKWLVFQYPKNMLGADRFDDEAVAEWEKNHPGTLDFSLFFTLNSD